MLLTNKFNFPSPIYKAISWQEQSHKPQSDISCTGLIDSPLKLWLKNKYYDYLEDDVNNRLFMFGGAIVHLILQGFGKDKEELVEQEVMADVLGWKVSTQIDYMLRNKYLADYKYTTKTAASKYLKDGTINDDWVKQVNVELWLLRNCDKPEMVEIGKGLKQLFICLILRDLYPRDKSEFQQGIYMLEVPIWKDDVIKKYVEDRIKLHQEARALSDEEVPPICEERYSEGFGVMQHGRKKALKANIPTREEAERLLSELEGDYIREAGAKKCESYCVYSQNNFCPWYDYENKQTRTESVIADIPEDPDRQRKDGPNI